MKTNSVPIGLSSWLEGRRPAIPGAGLPRTPLASRSSVAVPQQAPTIQPPSAQSVMHAELSADLCELKARVQGVLAPVGEMVEQLSGLIALAETRLSVEHGRLEAAYPLARDARLAGGRIQALESAVSELHLSGAREADVLNLELDRAAQEILSLQRVVLEQRQTLSTLEGGCTKKFYKRLAQHLTPDLNRLENETQHYAGLSRKEGLNPEQSRGLLDLLSRVCGVWGEYRDNAVAHGAD